MPLSPEEVAQLGEAAGGLFTMFNAMMKAGFSEVQALKFIAYWFAAQSAQSAEAPTQ